MRKLIVSEFMSLDGIVQAPMYQDEDEDGGFDRGGWHPRYFDDQSMQWTAGNIAAAGAYLFGRRTYENFAAYWPNASDDERELAQPLNERPKYVASTTLRAPLAWQNSTLLRGDVGTAVAALKQTEGDDLHVIGSAQLVRTLIEQELVDEFRLMIDPVLVGGGKRFFPDDGTLTALSLVESQVTATGAILATYVPAGGSPR